MDLSDGRSISALFGWWHGTKKERKQWRLIRRDADIHWPDLDEDISLIGLLQGRPSSESDKSLERWLQERADQ